MSRVAIMGIEHGPVQPVELAVPPDRVELGQEVFHEETGSQVDNIVGSVIQGASTSCKPEIGPSPSAQFAPMLERFTIRGMRLILTARETASAAFRYLAQRSGRQSWPG